MKKAIFLDRDGTINRDSKNYIKSTEEFVIFPNTAKGLKILQDIGYELIVITNQSGISRGFFSIEDLDNIHNKLIAELEQTGISLLDIYYCPHLPEENCECRKPKLKNVQKAIDDYDLDINNSWFIGDSEKDIITGQNASCKTMLVLSGVRGITEKTINSWSIKPDFISKDLLEAAKIIRKLDKEN